MWQPPRLLLLLTLCLTFVAMASSAVSQSLDPALAAKAAVRGKLRVLVELDVPFASEGRMGTRARGRQRARLDEAGDAVVRALGPRARRVRRFRTIPFVAMEVGPAELASLQRSRQVRRVQEDLPHRPLLMDTVPIVQAPILHSGGWDGSGWSIAVIDSGVDAAHPYLSGSVLSSAEACFSQGADCPNTGTSQTGPGAAAFCTYAPDACGHGTHVAGIAVGGDSSVPGVAPEAGLIPIQVGTRETDPGECADSDENPCWIARSSDIALALEHVYSLRFTHQIAAVNISLGTGRFTSTSTCDTVNAAAKAAIDNLRAAGIPTIIAAGNDGFTNSLSSPGCISTAISVGVSSKNDTAPSWGNQASFLTMLAPGTTMQSSVPAALNGGDDLEFRAGTSMSAPHVAGAFALLREVLPTEPLENLIDALVNTGVPITNAQSGLTRPRLDVYAALDSLVAACDNGIDDDSDGLVDFPADPGCADASSSVEDAGAGPADLDQDGIVGSSDFFGVFRPCLGADLASQPECTAADLDGDGVVGASDFFLVFRPALEGS